MESNTISINSNISWKLLKDAVVAVNLDDGNYFTFNTVASLIWQNVDQGKSIPEIEQMIKQKYPDTTELTIKEDIDNIIEFWISEKLVTKNY